MSKTVVITGGTGSLGHQLVRTLIAEPFSAEVRVVSRDEEKQLRMRRTFDNDPKLKFYIGDVRLLESLKRPFDNADIVIHAAAMKQIDTCEYFPQEAIRTNVLGAENVCHAAEGVVSRCVAVSTDKACEPINTYGMTKGLQERIFTGWSNGLTVYSAVRYGNVVGSRGSVVPYFSDLTKEGKRLPITDTRMTRFWLQLKDAVGLVLHAVENSMHGEILVPKMKASKVTDLAEVMSNLPWYESGLRPGEKLHESIVSEEEANRSLDDERYVHVFPVETYYKGVIAPGHLNLHKVSGRIVSNNVEQMTKDDLYKVLLEEGWV